MNQFCNHCMSPIEDTIQVCPHCGKNLEVKPPVHHLLPGTMLGGRFQVGYALGEGGFGITYIGRDTKLNMKVAIKEFYPNGFVSRSNTISATIDDSTTQDRKEFFQKGKTRFLEEAQILAKFSGEPGIVDVRDFFEENNTAYIIMEFLDGCDLKTYLKKNGLLTAQQAVDLLTPMMNSLKKVHDQGLIHRDISPDNIMISGNSVKLLDFGAARTVSAEANKSLSVMLKPGFAPEEQYRSKGNQGPWTDIYALCATLYKCITGITPDDATQRVFSDEVKTPTALGFATPPQLEAALMKGMSVHQNDRYQSIDQLMAGFQGVTVPTPAGADDVATMYMQGQTVAPQTTPVATPVAPATSPVMPPMGGVNTAPLYQNMQPQPAKKSKLPLLLIVIILVIALAVGGVLAIFVFPKEQTAEETSSVQPSSVVSAPEQPQALTMSDNLFDFTFTLEGVVYQLPTAYQTFTQNGWTISGDSGVTTETQIAGNKNKDFYLAKDGKKIDVVAYNPTGNTKALKDCLIGAIYFDSDSGVSLTLPKNITLASDATAIKAAFGTPSDYELTETKEELVYYAPTGDDFGVGFRLSKNGSANQIVLSNPMVTAADATTTDPTRPAYLSNYKAPTAMSNTLAGSVVKVDGKLYQLPTPVSEFINDGWAITRQSGDVVSGGTTDITLTKNNRSMTVYIKNYGDYQTIPENCVVYRLVLEQEQNIPVEYFTTVPVTFGTQEAVAFPEIPEEIYLYEGSLYNCYSYSQYDDPRGFDLSLYFDIDNKSFYKIEITCEAWTY